MIYCACFIGVLYPLVDGTNWHSSEVDETHFLKTLKKQHSHTLIQHSVGWRTNLEHQIINKEKDDGTLIDFGQAKNPYMRKPVTISTVNSQDRQHSKFYVTPRLSATDEWKLRDHTTVIPLDCSPGTTVLDPRLEIKQFSHIRVDFFLQRPAFAHSVVWGPEDNISLMIPKHEQAINLLRSSQIENGFSEYVDGSDISVGTIVEHPDKLRSSLSHQVLKAKMNRLGNLDSKRPANRIVCSSLGMAKHKIKCLPHHVATSSKLDFDKIPFYSHQLASSASNNQRKIPTTLLGAVTLYDPQIHMLLSSNQHTEKLVGKTEMIKQSVKCENLHYPHVSSPVQVASEKFSIASKKDLNTNNNQCDQPLGYPCSDASSPAMHNLPVKPLVGLMHPVFMDSPQNRPSAARVQEQMDKTYDVKEKEKNLLRDVFKTFDPSSTPFY